MKMTTHEILTRAQGKIKSKKTWTQEQVACDANGYSVDAKDPTAVRFCALGAIDAVSGSTVAFDLLNDTAMALYGCEASQVNDESGHKEVMKVYKEAIRSAQVCAWRHDRMHYVPRD